MAETIGHDAKVPQNSGEYGTWAGQQICDRCWSYTHSACRKGACQCPCTLQSEERLREAIVDAYAAVEDIAPDWANIKYADELADFLDDVWNAKRIPKEIRDQARELRHKLDMR